VAPVFFPAPLSIYLMSLVLLRSFFAAIAVNALLTHGIKDESKLGSGEMFDSIAPYYDTANTVMSLGQHYYWRRYLIDAVILAIPLTIAHDNKICDSGSCKAESTFKVLDLATGTADVAILLAQTIMSSVDLRDELRIAPISITGIDPSKNMLDIAGKKVSQKKLSSMIQLKVGDAENLSGVGNNEYNALTMSFGIRNVKNRKLALSEIFRVLKTSPRPSVSNVFILEFVSPSEGWLAPLGRLFLQYLVPLLGRLSAAGGHSAEYQHLADSIQRFPNSTAFLLEMSDAGFSNCRAENVYLHIVYLFTCEKRTTQQD